MHALGGGGRVAARRGVSAASPESSEFGWSANRNEPAREAEIGPESGRGFVFYLSWHNQKLSRQNRKKRSKTTEKWSKIAKIAFFGGVLEL